MSIRATPALASKSKDNSGSHAPAGSVAHTLQSILTTLAGMVSGTSVRGMSVQKYTGASPFNVAANANKDILAFWNPAGLLAVGTINIPDGSYDGQRLILKSMKVITLLTVNVATGSIQGAITTLALGGSAEYVWAAVDNTWYRAN